MFFKKLDKKTTKIVGLKNIMCPFFFNVRLKTQRMTPQINNALFAPFALDHALKSLLHQNYYCNLLVKDFSFRYNKKYEYVLVFGHF